VQIQQLRVIIAHSDGDTRRELTEAVGAHHTVMNACATTAEMLDAVRDQRPDLIIIGINFPDGNGLDAAIELGHERPIPTVVVTRERSLELVEQAMRDHVMAYLLEPVRERELEAAIIIAWSRFREFEEMRTQVDTLKAALDNRKTIERAKGLLMAQRGLAEHEAFDHLRRSAQSSRRTLADVAKMIIADQNRNDA